MRRILISTAAGLGLIAPAGALAHGGHAEEVHGPLHDLLHLFGGLEQALAVLALTAAAAVGVAVWRSHCAGSKSARK